MIPVLLFLPDVNGGGAQRTVINIANHIQGEIFRSILVIGWTKGPYLELINENVNIVDLGCRYVRNCILPLAKYIRGQKPRILFSPYPDANIALMLAKALACSKSPIVLRESNHRTAQDVEWGFLKSLLVTWSYRQSDKVVALSNGVRDDLIERYKLPLNQVKTIYNPVDLKFIQESCNRTTREYIEGDQKQGRFIELIAIGQLIKQKGFDILIRSIERLKDKPIHLTIVGEGPERSSIMRLASELGVHEIVSMPGFKKNPYIWLKQSDIFVLSSRWEGFGHVIVEAMACGLPVIATRCLSGPDEIITDGKDGLLCEPESVEDLAEKIGYLIDQPDERKNLARAGERTAQRFSTNIIIPQYEKLFRDLLN